MFKIRVRTDVSLGTLLDLMNEGMSVTKSPHVGNWYMSNLIIGSTGVFMFAYDRTIGDKIFRPEVIIKNRQKTVVGQQGVLTTHAKVVVEHNGFEVGQKLAECHLSHLRQALPQVQVCQYSLWLEDHRQLVEKVVEISQRLQPWTWTRFVTHEGLVVKKEGVKPTDPVMMATETEGWIKPNLLNLLLTGVVEALRTNRSEVWHISGPAMYRYAGEMEADLSLLYQELRKEMPGLPNEITYQIVPLHRLRLACPEGKESILEEIVRLATTNNDLSAKVQNKLIRLTRECPEPFWCKDPERGNFFSQYDLLGRRLWVHPSCLSMTPGQLERLDNILLPQAKILG